MVFFIYLIKIIILLNILKMNKRKCEFDDSNNISKQLRNIEDADIHYTDSEGNNLLALMCINGNRKDIMYLLQKGVSINTVNLYGDTPFTLYFSLHNIKQNWEFIVKLLNYVDNIDVKNKYGFSLLSIVVHKRLNKYALQLIKKGANINQVDSYGVTPLLRSIIVCNKNISIFCYYHECEEKYDEYNEELNDYQEELNEPKQLKFITELIELNAEIETVDIDGNNALIFAVNYSNIPILKLLLKNGAIPNVFNENNHSALMLATMRENYDIAKILLQFGADVNLTKITTNSGLKYNPLYIAIKSGNNKLIDLFHKYKASYF